MSICIGKIDVFPGQFFYLLSGGRKNIQQMSYNDQESHHLLVWVNRERLVIGEIHRIYSFDQLRTSRIIPTLLSKINPHFFSDISEEKFDHNQYLLKIEKYLSQVEDLKFKRSFRQKMLETEYISDLVKLILFLIMRHSIKQEFVNRILELEDETQMYLMYEIKRVEGWLENKMEVKEVLQTIQNLEEENQILYQKLREIQCKNKQVSQLKTQLQQENAKFVEIQRSNHTEKNNFIEQFGISHPKEYLTIYKDLVIERNEIITSHTQSETLIATLAQENKEMQEKIVEDGLIIDHLSEQMNKYKEIYCHLKKSTLPSSDFSRLDKENIEKECSATLESIRMVKSVVQESDHVEVCEVPSIKEFQQDEPLEEIMHHYQEDLMGKLQEMYVKIGSLNSQISDLKGENSRITSTNQRLEQTISQAYEQYQQFSVRYKLTMN